MPQKYKFMGNYCDLCEERFSTDIVRRDIRRLPGTEHHSDYRPLIFCSVECADKKEESIESAWRIKEEKDQAEWEKEKGADQLKSIESLYKIFNIKKKVPKGEKLKDLYERVSEFFWEEFG